MRCGNCGFQNPDSAVRCEKCNAPLSGSIAGDSPRQRQAEPEQNMRCTKREIDSNVSVSSNAQGNGGGVCHVCGFELSGIEKVCPMCGATVKSNVPRDNEPRRDEGTGERKEDKKYDKPLGKMTVSPWDVLYKQSKEGVFYLEPIPLESERKTLDTAVFVEKDVVLSRENTESGNLTISSDHQAEIRCINDQFYILDTSSMGTTFVQAKKPMPIDDGDVILLGSRRFVFKKKSDSNE